LPWPLVARGEHPPPNLSLGAVLAHEQGERASKLKRTTEPRGLVSFGGSRVDAPPWTGAVPPSGRLEVEAQVLALRSTLRAAGHEVVGTGHDGLEPEKPSTATASRRLEAKAASRRSASASFREVRARPSPSRSTLPTPGLCASSSNLCATSLRRSPVGSGRTRGHHEGGVSGGRERAPRDADVGWGAEAAERKRRVSLRIATSSDEGPR